MKETVLLSMGLGVAVGAVAVLMLPRQSQARKLARKAADTVEDAVSQISDKVSQELDCFD